jgi:MFS family permease
MGEAEPVSTGVAQAAAPAPHNRPRLFAPLSVRDFRFLWGGEGISILGTQFHLVALPWLVLQVTGSSVALGTVLMAAAIPRALLMLIGGALTDHFSPRTMMLLSNAARGVLSATLALLIASHHLHLWHLYAIPALFGTFDALFYPAYQSILPRLLPQESLPAGNALMQATIQTAMIAGPAPAGALIAAFSLAWAFGIDAASFAVAFTMLLMIAAQAGALPHTTRKSVLHSIAEGARCVNRDRPLRAFVLMACGLNLTVTGPFMVGMPLLAKGRFANWGGGSLAYGIMFSAFGAGALIGGLSAGSFRRVPRPGLFLVFVMFLIAAGMAVLGYVPWLWVSAAMMAAMGLGVGVSNITNITWIQRRAEPQMLGRVMSVMMFGGLGLVPVSMAVAGVIARFGVQVLFGTSAAAIATVAALALFAKPVREIK